MIDRTASYDRQDIITLVTDARDWAAGLTQSSPCVAWSLDACDAMLATDATGLDFAVMAYQVAGTLRGLRKSKNRDRFAKLLMHVADRADGLDCVELVTIENVRPGDRVIEEEAYMQAPTVARVAEVKTVRDRLVAVDADGEYLIVRPAGGFVLVEREDTHTVTGEPDASGLANIYPDHAEDIMTDTTTIAPARTDDELSASIYDYYRAAGANSPREALDYLLADASTEGITELAQGGAYAAAGERMHDVVLRDGWALPGDPTPTAVMTAMAKALRRLTGEVDGDPGPYASTLLDAIE